MNRRTPLLCVVVVLIAGCKAPPTTSSVPRDVLIRLIEAEDTRTWNAEAMGTLLGDPNPAVRSRAALAAGRIGDEGAISKLSDLLMKDSSAEVAAMAAFALGEMESVAGVPPLLEILKKSQGRVRGAAVSALGRIPGAQGVRPLLENLKQNKVRAAAVEALGKIAATLPEEDKANRQRIGDAILELLKQQKASRHSDHQVMESGFNAAFRAKPEGGAAAMANFVDSEIYLADALNVLAHLRAKVSLNDIREILANDHGPDTRANAARVLGAAGDVPSLDALEATTADDVVSSTRVAAIRALGSIAQGRSVAPLLKRADVLLRSDPLTAGELIEIVTALGRILPNSNNEKALALIMQLRKSGLESTEVESAFARIAPQRFLDATITKNATSDWQQISATAAGLTEIAALKDQPALKARALSITQGLTRSQTPDKAMPDVLRALQAFKPDDLAQVMRSKLKSQDVVVRATAAEILAELPQSKESTVALLEALPAEMQRKQNYAAFSIVGALKAAKDPAATAALVQAAKGPDYLVRRRAIEALKGKPEGAGLRVGPVNSRNTRADYERAAARVGKHPEAQITTDKGTITLALQPDEAPLTVDNFIQLAEAHYFDGLTFHRVVQSFGIQGGDPRGDGHGGPGYEIRCEISPLGFDEWTVGMALSGKDTGGSQFFITILPQHDLDGHYTAFARVVDGRDVVDRIQRGDRIRSVTITETAIVLPRTLRRE